LLRCVLRFLFRCLLSELLGELLSRLLGELQNSLLKSRRVCLYARSVGFAGVAPEVVALVIRFPPRALSVHAGRLQSRSSKTLGLDLRRLEARSLAPRGLQTRSLKAQPMGFVQRDGVSRLLMLLPRLMHNGLFWRSVLRSGLRLLHASLLGELLLQLRMDLHGWLHRCWLLRRLHIEVHCALQFSRRRLRSAQRALFGLCGGRVRPSAPRILPRHCGPLTCKRNDVLTYPPQLLVACQSERHLYFVWLHVSAGEHLGLGSGG
jgi:hypothetical protein